MKINLTNGDSIDTNKLNDKDAALHEAISNLYSVCEKFNVVGFAKVVLKEDEALGMLHLPNQTDEIRSKEYSKLIASLAEWVYKTSEGRLMIVDNQEDDEEGKGLE